MPICCKTCDGKGGWVNDDSAPDFCGDSDIETCYSCKGSGVVACAVCGEDAESIQDDEFVCDTCAWIQIRHEV